MLSYLPVIGDLNQVILNGTSFLNNDASLVWDPCLGPVSGLPLTRIISLVSTACRCGPGVLIDLNHTPALRYFDLMQGLSNCGTRTTSGTPAAVNGARA
jgi:hypothetical protein